VRLSSTKTRLSVGRWWGNAHQGGNIFDGHSLAAALQCVYGSQPEPCEIYASSEACVAFGGGSRGYSSGSMPLQTLLSEESYA
jgi:hypothetical protein